MRKSVKHFLNNLVRSSTVNLVIFSLAITLTAIVADKPISVVGDHAGVQVNWNSGGG